MAHAKRRRAAWLPVGLVLAGLAAGLPAGARGQASGAEDAERGLLVELAGAIESLSDYRVDRAALPSVHALPQRELEARFCQGLCTAIAAYLPGEGIFLSAHLDPLHQPEDRAALLHELVHHVQQGHPRFAGMAPCLREREKEREAFALQNAYLARLGQTQRVRFNDDFDCEEGDPRP